MGKHSDIGNTVEIRTVTGIETVHVAEIMDGIIYLDEEVNMHDCVRDYVYKHELIKDNEPNYSDSLGQYDSDMYDHDSFD